MTWNSLASWVGVLGSALQLLGSAMTLWGLLSAAKTWGQKGAALIGALWRSPASRVAASLSALNETDQSSVLQGLAFLLLGYLLALVSQTWLILLQTSSSPPGLP